jgi:hypothetical protein
MMTTGKFLASAGVGIFLGLHLNAQQKDSSSMPSYPQLENADTVYSGTLSRTVQDSIYQMQRAGYRKAAYLSAILPGAGQVYNKKYWKVPLVYAGLGIPVYFYFSNKAVFQEAQYALVVTVNKSPVDSFLKVQPYLRPLVETGNVNALITERDEARKYQDYSVLFFLLFYALNIVDATVDAHLKDFNVNNSLSFQIRPVILPGPIPAAGVCVALNMHNPRFPSRPLN